MLLQASETATRRAELARKAEEKAAAESERLRRCGQQDEPCAARCSTCRPGSC